MISHVTTDKQEDNVSHYSEVSHKSHHSNSSHKSSGRGSLHSQSSCHSHTDSPDPRPPSTSNSTAPSRSVSQRSVKSANSHEERPDSGTVVSSNSIKSKRSDTESPRPSVRNGSTTGEDKQVEERPMSSKSRTSRVQSTTSIKSATSISKSSTDVASERPTSSKSRASVTRSLTASHIQDSAISVRSEKSAKERSNSAKKNVESEQKKSCVSLRSTKSIKSKTSVRSKRLSITSRKSEVTTESHTEKVDQDNQSLTRSQVSLQENETSSEKNPENSEESSEPTENVALDPSAEDGDIKKQDDVSIQEVAAENDPRRHSIDSGKTEDDVPLENRQPAIQPVTHIQFLDVLKTLSAKLESEHYQDLDSNISCEEMKGFVQNVGTTIAEFKNYASQSQDELHKLREVLNDIHSKIHTSIEGRVYKPDTSK